MPIYEYRCESCGHELEAMQRMSDAPLTECPACGKSALKKQVSATGFRLSGGGWYETDFKKDGKRNIAAKDGGGGDSKPSGCSACAASDGT
ncbi:MAG: zinc ribbon domain-containing protein [Acidihalobacter sp.]|jgi:putative FmdB family regulatory protein|uniref:FmdB family zinc ribbon protein n=1 Tax=Acidihalobacter sp. TaxID=1872108 RepID=UPI00307FA7D6